MKRILIATGLMFGFIASAHAVPWCYRGHIYTAATVHYTEQNLLNWANANINWGNPPNVIDLDHYIAGEASFAACQVYAGWSGPNYGVPGAGQVYAQAFAPSSYTSGNGYSISQGLSFHCRKCSPLPVAVPIREER
jgi:hypothetical protein